MRKKVVLDFFKSNIHAVIATCGRNGQPESALIGFGQTDSLELIFGTYNTSKKYHNIQDNNKVAFVIGWAEDYITVQYEGIATEIFGEERQKYVDLYHQKVPSAVHYQSHPSQTYFKVSPIWIRYSDLSSDEDKIVEFSF